MSTSPVPDDVSRLDCAITVCCLLVWAATLAGLILLAWE